MCTVLVIALAMFGTGALAKPGYAAGYAAVDYYVSVRRNYSVCFKNLNKKIVKDFPIFMVSGKM